MSEISNPVEIAAPSDLQALITARFTDQAQFEVKLGEAMLTVSREQLLPLMRFLHDETACQFTMRADITAGDHPNKPERFCVVYNLLSVNLNRRIRIKLWTDEATPIDSVTGIWPAAGWFEREVWDMYGVFFSGNPDLRRILTDYGFDGHPLRKDFPLTGHVEVRYDPVQERVIYEPVKLTQAFRKFDFLSPWDKPDYVLPGDEKAASPPAVTDKKAG